MQMLSLSDFFLSIAIVLHMVFWQPFDRLRKYHKHRGLIGNHNFSSDISGGLRPKKADLIKERNF
jgi:hypothetical protein